MDFPVVKKYIFLVYNAHYKNGKNPNFLPLNMVMFLTIVEVFVGMILYMLLEDNLPVTGFENLPTRLRGIICLGLLGCINYLIFVKHNYFTIAYNTYCDTNLNTPLKCNLTAGATLFLLVATFLLISYLKTFHHIF